MKKIETHFYCDRTGCDKSVEMDTEDLPVNKGWFIINGVDMLLPADPKKSQTHFFDFVVDKQMHFCSRVCFSKFITEHIDKAEKGFGGIPQMEHPEPEKPHNFFSIGLRN